MLVLVHMIGKYLGPEYFSILNINIFYKTIKTFIICKDSLKYLILSKYFMGSNHYTIQIFLMPFQNLPIYNSKNPKFIECLISII